MKELRQFGEEAENDRFPIIDVGGVILPGESATFDIQPGEDWNSAEGQGTQTRSEARSAAGSRQGPPAEAASGEAAHSVECELIDRELEELKRYHPQATEIFSSSSFVLQRIPVRLFSSLPHRATLVLEIPRCASRQAWPIASRVRMVPDVRAWAFWDGQSLIRSHHQLPDGSMCAYMPVQGLFGVTPLYQIVGMCICWIGKCLYNQAFDRWPGPQHYGPLEMRLRDRRDEFCGCGKKQRYAACCRTAIEAAPFRDLLAASFAARMTYGSLLRMQKRLAYPWSWSVLGEPIRPRTATPLISS